MIIVTEAALLSNISRAVFTVYLLYEVTKFVNILYTMHFIVG